MNKLMAAGLAFTAVLGTAAAGDAQAQRRGAITSAYSDLDLKQCRVLRQVKEGASVEWQCPGVGDTPLMVASSDDRFDIDAGVFNQHFESTILFSSPGSRVEWRLRGGQPFAIIYRLRATADNRPETTVLGVETIGRSGRPGCLVA